MTESKETNPVLDLRDIVVEIAGVRGLQPEAFLKGNLWPKDVSFIMLDEIASALKLIPVESNLPATTHTYWVLAERVMDYKVAKGPTELASSSDLERYDVFLKMRSAEKVFLDLVPMSVSSDPS